MTFLMSFSNKYTNVANIVLKLIDKVFLFLTVFDNSPLFVLNKLFDNDDINY